MELSEQAAALQSVQHLADRLIQLGAATGVVVTIEQVPRAPLAMGNYETVARVRLAQKGGK